MDTVHRSNASPYFIGVFDTVAALGVKGLLAIGIKIFLAVGAALLAAALALAPALIVAGILSLFGFTFWFSVLAFVGLAAVAGVVLITWQQRKSIKKVIRDFPNPGDKSSHLAEWKGENFDRLLSRFVGYARSANAIDETREDFTRVGWGPTRDMPEERNGVRTFKQLWFAGNHSDIGGSYPESESRLSDIALKWMIEEVVGLPDGLKMGPVIVDGKRLPQTPESGTPLHLFPRADALQHCEVAGTQDVLEARIPHWLRPLTSRLGWKTKIREINPEAPVHPTVEERFQLLQVPQCAGFGSYRPEALRNHEKFRAYYE